MKQNNIEISDEFTEPTGEWTNYAAINTEQNEALRKQKHVDIRSFENKKLSTPTTMLLMDRLVMAEMDGAEIGSFELALPVVNNEGWSYGEVGPQSDRNNWNGIKVVCDPAISAETTTQSVITQNG